MLVLWSFELFSTFSHGPSIFLFLFRKREKWLLLDAKIFFVFLSLFTQMPKVRDVKIDISFEDLFQEANVKLKTFTSDMKRKSRRKYREKLMARYFRLHFNWFDTQEVKEEINRVSKSELKPGQFYTLFLSRNIFISEVSR